MKAKFVNEAFEKKDKETARDDLLFPHLSEIVDGETLYNALVNKLYVPKKKIKEFVHANNDLALRWASKHGHANVVKILLDAGADVHADNDYALRWASNNGHAEIVKILLDAGADVHAVNDLALKWASKRGHANVVKILLDAGADKSVLNETAKAKFVNEAFEKKSK